MDIQANVLRDYCTLLFEKTGVPKDESFINADNLVAADLAGIESHGVARMSNYLKRIRTGVVTARCQLRIMGEQPATALVDAGNALGAVAGVRSMELAINKAKVAGVSLVCVKNSSHFGVAAYHARMALAHDMIGFAATNGAARMAPWGGREAFWGTNPFAVAVPSGSHPPIVADMATSVVALGKVLLAAKKNVTIPLGWARNRMGEDTTDAREFYDVEKGQIIGTGVPVGGPKGSAIALLIDVLSGVLSGSVFGPHVGDMLANFSEPAEVSHVFGAINVSAFIPASQFQNGIDSLITEVKSGAPANGVTEIFLPGEIEYRETQKRLVAGIPVSDVILAELRNEGKACGVPFELLINE